MRFRKGSRVEVLRLKEAPYGGWRAGEILSGNGHTYSVRYYSYGLAKDEALEERVARKSIRPCPPQIDVDRWEAGELVEVLDNVFWKAATVLQELSGRYYVVRLLGAALELTVPKINLRARQCWQDDDRWVMIGKVSCSVKSSTLTESDVNQNLKPHETSVVSERVLKRPSPCDWCESAESFIGGHKKKMRSKKEGDAAWCSERSGGKQRLQASVNNSFRQMVRVRSKRSSECVVGTGSSVYSGCCDTDASSVGSCSPIIYDESDTSTSFLDVSSSQEADGCSSDAESSKGCREEEAAGGTVRGSCRPELYTYRTTLGKLFASGPLDWNQEASLTDLRLSLNISSDEHLIEIRNLKSVGTAHTKLC